MCVKLLRLNCDLGCIFLQIIGSATDQGSFSGTAPANALTYLSPALAAKTDYTFQVTAVNGAGDGESSPDIVVQTNFSGML